MKNMLTMALLLVSFGLVSCENTETSDTKAQKQQEKILQEAQAELGMPAIHNFRNKRLLKMIRELCDQDGFITYLYTENQMPKVVVGHTCKGGKFTYVGECVGYPIPYATQYTNPSKAEWGSTKGWLILPQADPDGLFYPASAEATWIIMKNPHGNDVKPIYMEPRSFVSPWKFDFDTANDIGVEK